MSKIVKIRTPALKIQEKCKGSFSEHGVIPVIRQPDRRYVVTGFKTAAKQGRHKRRAAVVNSCNGRRYSSRPERRSYRQLSLDAHVTAVCRSGFYQLRQLRPIARSLSVETAKSLVQAFLSSRLDYCNAILHGLPDRMMRSSQSVQNAAARLITSARPRTAQSHHTDTVIASLHGCQYDDMSTSRLPSWFSSA